MWRSGDLTEVPGRDGVADPGGERMPGRPGVAIATGHRDVDDAGDVPTDGGADVDTVGGRHVVTLAGRQLRRFGAVVGLGDQHMRRTVNGGLAGRGERATGRSVLGAERLEGGSLGLRLVAVDGVHGAAGVLDVQGGAAGIPGNVAGIDVEL